MNSFLSVLLKRILKYSLIAALLWVVLLFAMDLDAGDESIIINLLTCLVMGFITASPVALVVSIIALITKPKEKIKAKNTSAEHIKNKPEKLAVNEEQKNTPADVNEPSKQTTNNELLNFTPTIVFSFDDKDYSDDKEPLVKRNSLRLKTINDYRKFKNYIVLDVETTGFDKKVDKIIEIGMLKIKDGVVVDRYVSFVNPETHIPSKASAVNGIFDIDVENAPVIGNIIQDIVEFMEELPIVCHNTSFDISFIAREMEQKEIQKDLYYYDTIPICKDALEPLPNYKLETVMKHLNIQEVQTHRALDDAEVVLEVLRKCIDAKIGNYEKEQLEKKAKKKAEDALRKERFGKSTLYNIGFAFTGEFTRDRDVMIGDLMSVGGLNKSTVSKSSKYLVKGDISTYSESAIRNKYEKALTLAKEGNDIKIISETDFYVLINEARESLK